MSPQKTTPSSADPREILAAVPAPGRRADALAALDLFARATGERATVWGPSMIGFGAYRYRYASGHEGRSLRVGFAARSTGLALYGLTGLPRSEELLARLGPVRRGAGCVYAGRLAALDAEVLEELLRYAAATPRPEEIPDTEEAAAASEPRE